MIGRAFALGSFALGVALCGCSAKAFVPGPESDAAPEPVDGGNSSGDAGGADASGDAKADSAACPKLDAVSIKPMAKGVQCDTSGDVSADADFCVLGKESCCAGGNPALKCTNRGNCGSLIEFACDTPLDCAPNQKCCLRTGGVANQQCRGQRITATTGSVCKTLCAADEISLCLGEPPSLDPSIHCGNSPCAALDLISVPGKRLNGCL
jgi:hypothetical protein